MSDKPLDSNVSKTWERDLIEKVLWFSVREQRAARRWKIFFRLVFLSICALLVWRGLSFSGDWPILSGRHTALVSLEGELTAESGVNAHNINMALEEAFSNEDAVGVILFINSPGGSPVQAGMINDTIHRLKAKYPKKPLYAVVGVVCASAAYYVAVAADKIFVNQASLVGSIGVRSTSFGVKGLMEKLGIERRVLVAGQNKMLNDPFSPQSAAHKQHLQEMLDQIHTQFIKAVRQGRGARLHETPEIFSGLIWTGEKSIEMGLVDGSGNNYYVAHDLLKASEIVNYTIRENLLERVGNRFGLTIKSGWLDWLRSNAMQLY